MRFSTGILAIIMLAVTLPVSVAQAGFIDALTANGTGRTQAVFFHGYIYGNDDKGGGEPLLGYLNNGTAGIETNKLPELDLQDDAGFKTFTISSAGMFTGPNNLQGDPPLEYNYVTKDPDVDDASVPSVRYFDADTEWSYRGKYDTEVGGGEFTGDSGGLQIKQAGNGKAGEIEVVVNNGSGDTGLSGDWVVSLKASNEFSVFAFQGLSNATQFTFSGLDHGLSHVTFYQADSETPTPGPFVPEPSSISVFFIAGCCPVRGRDDDVL